MLLLAGFAAFSIGCSSTRNARKARKVEAARRADSIAAARRTHDSLSSRVDTTRASSSGDTVETAALDPSKSSVPSFILSLHGRTTRFETFSGKAKMEYESGGKSQEFTASFRIRRDSVIWISVVAMGGLVPVARLLITPDSFLLVNYLTREASRMPIEEATRLLPLPAQFSQLQALLLGDVLEPTADITSTGKAEGQAIYYVATRTPSAAYMAYYNATDSTLTGEEMVTTDRAVATNILYKAYSATAARRFATEREIQVDVDSAGTTLRHMLRMDFTDQARFDGPLEFSFSIPKNYTLK